MEVKTSTFCLPLGSQTLPVLKAFEPYWWYINDLNDSLPCCCNICCNRVSQNPILPNYLKIPLPPSPEKACKYFLCNFLPTQKKIKMLRSKIFVFLQILEQNLAKLNLSQNSIEQKHVIVFWFPAKKSLESMFCCGICKKHLASKISTSTDRSLAVQGIIFMVLAISIWIGCIVIKVMGWGESSILQKQHQSHQNHPPPSTPTTTIPQNLPQTTPKAFN